VFNSLVDAISGSGWTYAVIFAIALGDVLFPLLPSETVVITAGVLAASGRLSLPLVIVCAAAGACSGDNLAYLIGRLLKVFVRERLFGGKKRRHLDRAERSLRERGGSLIIVARFIPGGRSAVTFAAGVLRYRWRRFLSFDIAAGIFWACYASLIGYFGGKAFEDHPGRGIIAALVIALVFAGLFEGVRWLRRRSGQRSGRSRPQQPDAR
jgi:membrane protein DedA with SNARE-associated domain